jgi:crossover junction endodeoxyribonuclease RuvC
MGGGVRIRILGIDPGTLVVGFGCLEVTEAAPDRDPRPRRLALSAANVMTPRAGRNRVALLDAGVLELGSRSSPIEDRLLELSTQFGALLARLSVDEIALEEAFYKKSVAAALRIGEARGVILAGARKAGLRIRQFAPARIKRAVAGHGGASKEAVARMVCRLLAVPSLPTARDVTDALAAALCLASETRHFVGGSPCKSALPDL